MNDKRLTESALEDLVGQVAGEFTDRLQRGERPDVEDYIHRYPEIADVLRQMLPALRVMKAAANDPEILADSGRSGATEESASDAGSGSGFPTLSDYRVLREVGRGGM